MRVQAHRPWEDLRVRAQLQAHAQAPVGLEPPWLLVSEVRQDLPHLRWHESTLQAGVRRSTSLQVSTLRHEEQVHAGCLQAHQGEASQHGVAFCQALLNKRLNIDGLSWES